MYHEMQNWTLKAKDFLMEVPTIMKGFNRINIGKIIILIRT